MQCDGREITLNVSSGCDGYIHTLSLVRELFGLGGKEVRQTSCSLRHAHRDTVAVPSHEKQESTLVTTCTTLAPAISSVPAKEKVHT